MKRLTVFVLFVLCAVASSFATTSVSVGTGLSSRGMLNVEQTFLNDRLAVGASFNGLDDDFLYLGVNVSWHPMGFNGPYLYHSSQWVHDLNSTWNVHHNHYEDHSNFWRLMFGVGFQQMFFKHFGAYAELGFHFYAGQGGYYTHLDTDHANLDNESIEFPVGIGLKFPF